MHNSISKGDIKTFYLSNNCSTIKDIYSFSRSCVLDTIGELSVQTPNATYFLIQHFCAHLYTRNSKITGRMLTFYICSDYSTIGDVNFLCKSWMQDANGKVHLETRIAVSFQYSIFAHTVQIDM